MTVELYLGDCLDILPTLEAGSLAFVNPGYFEIAKARIEAAQNEMAQAEMAI